MRWGTVALSAWEPQWLNNCQTSFGTNAGFLVQAASAGTHKTPKFLSNLKLCMVAALIIGGATFCLVFTIVPSNSMQHLLAPVSNTGLDLDNAVDIDLVQAQLLDFLNGEESVNDTSAFGGSLSSSFDSDIAWDHVIAHAETIPHGIDTRDFRTLGNAARSLFLLQRLISDKPESNSPAFNKRLNQTIGSLTEILFPWVSPTFPTIADMHATFEAAKDPIGFVITGGTRHFFVIQHVILTLRQEFNITLPIQVFYNGKEDMAPEKARFLSTMENVEVEDLMQYFTKETSLGVNWSVKPFAILASRFRKVLFLDADVLFFKNPVEVVTNSSIFRKNGVLFFRDRKLREHRFISGVKLFAHMNPHPTQYARTLGYVNAESDPSLETHGMDSGFIAADKGNMGVLFSLLLASKMNSREERSATLYANTYGDKESFWFSTELLRVPYEFNHAFGSALGRLDEGMSKPGYPIVCGVWLLQTDPSSRNLFYWNGGGVLKNRDAAKVADFEFMNFTHAAVDYNGVRGGWPAGHCANFTQDGVFALSNAEQLLMERYRDIFRHQVKEA
ncbi:hypothetical protein HDU78_010328 [Chytriomyces hyalinus]|nr:hypothetical protein HDU78_010328 [Chytriomyces hyalinus]